jgi:DNA-binding beta-propeller fold protein YncE
MRVIAVNRHLLSAFLVSACLSGAVLPFSSAAQAGQAPAAASASDIPLSHRDRVYAAEQFSNTVSVTDPADNKLLGVIRLGDPQPGNFSPLYKGQVLVHGMGFSPDPHLTDNPVASATCDSGFERSGCRLA